MGRGEIWLADLSQSWLGRQLVIGQLILSLRFSAYGGLESAYLYGFRVKDQYRSQGVGSLMLDVVEESLRRRGCTSLLLNVAQVNNDARRLYERRRYQVMGEDEGHWFYTDHLGVSHEVHEPAWRMEKRLDLY
jgi:ribosomal protein S18 acetylase RimI-like enzyme